MDFRHPVLLLKDCMIRFLTWLRSILLSVVSGLAKTVVLAVWPSSFWW